MQQPGHILTVNTGSSSLKAALYDVSAREVRIATAEAERIGQQGSRLHIDGTHGAKPLDRTTDLPDHASALRALFDWLAEQGLDRSLAAAGHRVVHGGARRTTDGVTGPARRPARARRHRP